MEKTYEGFLKKKKEIAYKNYRSFTRVDLEDCLRDLEDDGFSIKCELSNQDELNKLINELEHRVEPVKESIRIFITKEVTFKFKEIKENLLFTLPYLEDEYGLKMSDIIVSYFVFDRFSAIHINDINSEKLDKIDIELVGIKLERI